MFKGGRKNLFRAWEKFKVAICSCRSRTIIQYIKLYEPIFSLGASIVIFLISLLLISQSRVFLDACLQQSIKYSVIKSSVSSIATLSNKKITADKSVDMAMSILRIVIDNFSHYQINLEKTGEGKVKLRVSDIPFTELIKMINDIQRVSHWVVENIRIDKRALEGIVAAEFSLRVLGKENK
ncbi:MULTISPECIES: hypothetical protein [Candidatus Ichthyocystis]|uniref:hypothetical protein n=1 Tax=Candidatus Ichthyocystis TaxID=2929841 RepID=UPI000B80514A|nr:MULTISPECIES: hypothetical protein [Ichthyocystis]